MATIKSSRFPAPKSWEELEILCTDLFKAIWKDESTYRVGRSGQSQHGVDIFGRTTGGQYVGVQVRNKIQPPTRLTLPELRAEVEKAQSFFPPLHQFVIATTAPNDSKIQQYAREITAQHEERGLFSVHVCGWDEIETKLADYPHLVKAHFSQFFSGSLAEPKLTELLEQQARWQEEKDRPRWDLRLQGGNHMAATFAPSFRLSHVSADVVGYVEWRFRGPRFEMNDWRGVNYGALERTRVTNSFNLTRDPGVDNLLLPDEMGIEIRFHWHGRVRHEMHRWCIERTQHPTKHMYEILSEVSPPIYFDEN